jgi:serine/threonine-protein kinase
MIGQTLAHYRITAKLGEGGMGVVYRATDSRLGREVALKVLPASMASDAERMGRFEREARTLAALNHPGIAAIYGVEERALVLELVEGTALAGPLSADVAAPLIDQLIEAIAYAHEKGVVHRDLKPANILVTPDGRLKVLDFGLAKAFANEPAASANPADSPTLTMGATMAGMIMGTAAYMAPEQARGLAVDKRADIWAFGCVVYELLTGRALFGGETVTDTLAQVLTKEIDFGAAPARYRPLLEACLERDPKLRLRDIGDAGRLRSAVAEVAPARRLPWIVAVAALAVAAVTTTVWLRSEKVGAPAARFSFDRTGLFAPVSPDGRWLLRQSPGALSVRPLNGGSWRALPGTERAYSPFWSEDSASIAFFAGERLRMAGVDGAAASDLGPASKARGGTWRGGAKDGLILFAAEGRLRLLDLRTRQTRDLPHTFPAAEPPSQPAFLPEGEGFVYLEGWQLMRSALSGGKSEPVVNTRVGVQFAKDPRSGRWLMFYNPLPPDRSRTRTLAAVSIDARTGAVQGEPVTLLDGMSINGNQYRDFAIGGSVITWQPLPDVLPIWRLKWFDGAGNVTGVASEKRSMTALALSPDETKVAVVEFGVTPHIWIYDTRTGVGERLANSPESEDMPAWAPDGRSIYYLSGGDDNRRLMRRDLNGAAPAEAIDDVSANLHEISPDGRYALFASSLGVFRLDLQGPKPRRLEKLIENASVSHVHVTRDGKKMYYLQQFRGLFVSEFPPDGKPSRQIAATTQEGWPIFAPDDRTVSMFTMKGLNAFPILPDGRVGESVFRFPLSHPQRYLSRIGAVSRDGKRILAIVTDEPEEANVQVVTDWTTLLPTERKQ